MVSESRFNRRRFLQQTGAAGAVLAAGSLLAACGQQAPTAPTSAPATKPTEAAKSAEAAKPTVAAAPAPAKGATKLILWRYTAAVQDSTFADFIKRFSAENQGVSVEEANFGPMAEYRQKVLAALAAKTAPEILYSDGPWLPEFASRKILDPAPPEVSQDLKTNYTRGGHAYLTFKGVEYGYPWETSIHQLFINDDLFKAAGLDPSKPPIKSFAEFREASKKLAKVEGGNVTQAGFLANQRLMYFGNFIYNNGGTIIGEDNEGNVPTEPKVALAEPKAMECWQLWYDMYNTDKSASAKLPANTDAFSQGKTAMVVTGNFFINGLQANAPNLKYTIAPQPTNTGKHVAQLGGWMATVVRDSAAEKKPMAWKFVQWSNSKENILFSLSRFIWLTTRKDAMADPKAMVLAPEKLKPFYDVMPDITHVRPKTTVYQQLESSLEPLIQRMLLGEINAKAAADDAVKKSQDLLKQEIKS